MEVDLKEGITDAAKEYLAQKKAQLDQKHVKNKSNMAKGLPI